MGRRPKPPAEQRLTGAGKRRPREIKAAAVSDGEFRAPPWLTRPGEIAVWNRIVPELRRLNILAPSDADTFGRYCRHFEEWIEASDTLQREGATVMVKMSGSEERMPRLNPAYKVRAGAEKQLLDIEDRFGGSPLARFRLVAQQAAHPGAFGDLFGRGRGIDPEAPPPSASPIGGLQRPVALN